MIDVDDKHFTPGELVGSLTYNEFKALAALIESLIFPKTNGTQ